MPRKKQSDTVKTLVLPFGQMSPDQMRSAFAVSETTLLWRAVVQTIEDTRQEYAHRAAALCAQGKTVETFAANGAFEALTNLLGDMEADRQAAMTKD